MVNRIPYTRYDGYTPKRLAVFCDGTWQSIRKDQRTNAARAAMAVDRFGADGRHQVIYYDDGVGALDSGFQRLMAGATGQGLDNRILSAYRFLTLNYEPGDEIYLFGFSRGAYTVRSLAGLMRTCGILRREYANLELEAMELYRRRTMRDESGAIIRLEDRDFADAVAFRSNYSRAWVRPSHGSPDAAADGKDTLTVAYLGVWDTVGSLGVPRVFGGTNKFDFHDTSIGGWIRRARHAVAIDEKRNSFAPTLWTNVDGPKDIQAAVQTALHPDARQMWFPGDHGGVGGGNGLDGLSNASLLWIIEEAQSAGLQFKPAILDSYRAGIDPVEARLGGFTLGSLPTWLRGWGWRKGLSDFEDIHETARKRWLKNRRYRSKPLKRFRKSIEDWNKYGDVAG